MYIIFRNPLELESSTVLFLNALHIKSAKNLIKTVQRRQFDKEKRLKKIMQLYSIDFTIRLNGFTTGKFVSDVDGISHKLRPPSFKNVKNWYFGL